MLDRITNQSLGISFFHKQPVAIRQLATPPANLLKSVSENMGKAFFSRTTQPDFSTQSPPEDGTRPLGAFSQDWAGGNGLGLRLDVQG